MIWWYDDFSKVSVMISPKWVDFFNFFKIYRYKSKKHPLKLVSPKKRGEKGGISCWASDGWLCCSSSPKMPSLDPSAPSCNRDLSWCGPSASLKSCTTSGKEDTGSEASEWQCGCLSCVAQSSSSASESRTRCTSCDLDSGPGSRPLLSAAAC